MATIVLVVSSLHNCGSLWVFVCVCVEEIDLKQNVWCCISWSTFQLVLVLPLLVEVLLTLAQ